MNAAVACPQPRRPGRPPLCPRELAARLVELRRQGLSYEAISDVLNAEGVPTPAGGSIWQRSYVDRLLHTRHVLELQEGDATRMMHLLGRSAGIRVPYLRRSLLVAGIAAAAPSRSGS